MKKIILLVGLLLASAYPVECFADTPAMEEQSTQFSQTDTSQAVVSPQSDTIGWRYKTVKGKLYKRKYNYSKKKWIGSWILA